MSLTDELKKEIKKNPFFANKEIKDEDVLNIMRYLEEKENCRKCKKLDDCKNSTKGYSTFVKEDNSIYCDECKYYRKAIEEKKKIMNNEIILSPKFSDASISNFRIDTESRKNCVKYLCDFLRSKEYMKGAYIYGDVGIGKTYLMVALIKELINRGKNPFYVYFPDMINEFKDNFDLLNEKINEYKNAEVLIIDDFGVGNMTPWVRDSILAPILNHRMIENKPLFISSNVKFNELYNYLMVPSDGKNNTNSARLVRRIEELCKDMSL